MNYEIRFSVSDQALFRGVLTVVNNEIERFYDFSSIPETIPVPVFGKNGLLPKTLTAYKVADNRFITTSHPFSDNGVNIVSDALQNYFQSESNKFKLYADSRPEFIVIDFLRSDGTKTGETYRTPQTVLLGPIPTVTKTYTVRVVGSNLRTYFYGYITVLSNEITGVYKFSNSTSILLPKTDAIQPQADNVFLDTTTLFTHNGMNLLLPEIKAKYATYSDHFNLFYDSDGFALKVQLSPNLTANIYRFQVIVSSYPPPVKLSMGSLYTNNAQVYYKPHSLSTGSGGVRNQRAKQRRT